MALMKNMFSESFEYLIRKQCLSVITENKKYSSKQVVPITCELEKNYFTAANFGGLRVVSFQTK